MKTRLKCGINAAIGLLLIHLSCFAQGTHFKLVTPPKDGPWTAMEGLTQDPEGYLWFATADGLYRYDGRTYTLYLHEPSNSNSLGANGLEDVFADKDGIIWIGTYGSGLDRLDPITGKFTHYRHNAKDRGSLLNDKVTTIIADHEGSMWIGTNGGLEKFDPKTGKFSHYFNNPQDAESLSNNSVRVIYEDRQGTIWVGTGSPWHAETRETEGGLNKLDKKTGKFTRYLHNPNDANSLIDNRVQAIFEDSRGTFWVGTAGDGLHTMDRNRGTFERYTYDPKHPEKLSRPPLRKDRADNDAHSDHVTFINEDASGKIWIGTFGNGINIYDPLTKKITWYSNVAKSKENIIPNVWRAYKSRDGIMWIATWGPGLYQVNPAANGLNYHFLDRQVNNFDEDSAGNLWIATFGGLIVKKAGQENWQTFILNKGMPKGDNVSYFLDYNHQTNSIWVSSTIGLFNFNPVTKSSALYCHRGGRPTSIRCDTVNVSCIDGSAKLWVGTYKGLDLMDTRSGTFQHIKNLPNDTGPTESSVYSLLETKAGILWIRTLAGLTRFNERTGVFKPYLNDKVIFSLKADGAGNLWAATDAGLFRYSPERDSFEIFTDAFGLLKQANGVLGITEDQQNNLWLTTLSGIMKLNVKNREATLYGKNKGVDGNSLTQYSLTTKSGEVIIGDTMGYYEFYPDKLLRSSPLPAINIISFALADVPVLPGPGSLLTAPLQETKKIVLSHSQNTFSLGFVNIDYLNDGLNSQLRYKLENFNTSWRVAGDDRVSYYYNIPAGNYIFKVKAMNDNGLWAEKDIEIIVLPPWWQTWWAYSFLAVLIAAAVWALVYYRSYQLKRENQALEQKIQVRTKELSNANHELQEQQEEISAQRDELSKTLDNLRFTQTQLVQREKMASLGELTAGIAHEIQNPLNFVNNFSEISVELVNEMDTELDKGDITEAKAIGADLKQNLGKIRQHGKRAESIIKGMLEHSRISKGERQPTDINALANEFFKLSYHGLRAKDKNFNAELITHFAHDLPKIDVVQQDMGRVLLNLFNNAFYAVNQKEKTAGAGYKPTVEVTTTTASQAPQPLPAGGEAEVICIKVRDNGNGIPDAIKDKIMQPFFTTKPTGEGTGLGLSLSYDIVVKGHGGSITVNTKEGEFTEFIVTLPAS